MPKIENSSRARAVYWVGLFLAVLLLYKIDNPLRDSLPVAFTTYGEEIDLNREYYATLLGEYRARASELEQELEATKAEACIRYEIEAFCFHHGSDLRDKWQQRYEEEGT